MLAESSIAPIERYLATVWERGGSDLLFTAFSPPLMRVDGQLIPIPGEPELDQAFVEQLVLGVLTDDLKTELRTNREVDFSFSYNKVARFRANCFFQMGALAMSLRMIPLKLPTFEELGLPPAVEYFANSAARAGARDRTDRFGKVDLARRDHRLRQHQSALPHHHDRRPRRVRAPAQELRDQSTRGRDRHPQLRPRVASRVCAKTPTSSSSARCATPRRSSSRSRSPRPATWCSRPCTPTTRPNRSTASRTCSPPNGRTRSASSSPRVSPA